MTTSVESTTLATSRQTQPKVQHMVITFMGNKSRVLQSLSKSLTTLDIFTVNGTLPSTDMVLIPARGGYHLLLLWEVCDVPYGCSHPTSFLASSSMMAPWLLIGLPP